MIESGYIDRVRDVPTFIPYFDWEMELLDWLKETEGNLIGYVITGGMTDNLFHEFKQQTMQGKCEACKSKDDDCPFYKYRVRCVVDHEHQEIVFCYTKCNQTDIVNDIRKKAYISSGLPARYWNFESKNFQKEGNESVLAIASNAIKSSKSVYIFGKVGSGKTLAISMIGRAFLNQKKSVQFYTSVGLLTKMREGLTAGANANETEDAVSAIHKKCKEADLLIIDDLGAEKPTDWAIEQLFLIINERYNDEKPTAITSNLSFEALENRLNKFGIAAERLLSRIGEFEKARTSNKTYR